MDKEVLRRFTRLDLYILIAILVIAFIFRLYKINIPLADLHSWRQADTAAVARNFQTDFNLLKPRYDDLTSIESGKENPEGYRFVEFPLYNAIVAALYKFLPLTTLEIYGRGITAAFSLIIIAVLYYLALKEHSRLAAIITASVYAIFPFFVFFSRVILPDTPSIAFAFMAIFFAHRFTTSEKQSHKIALYSLSLLSFATALLVKPTAIFYSIAIFFLFIRQYGFSSIKKVHVYIYFLLAAVPLALWRHYISAYPEGIPANTWLFRYVNTFEGPKDIFFTPAFFRWIFYERIGILMFGVYLSAFFLIGVFAKLKKYWVYSILLSAFVYLFTFQGGNVQHEYYQTVILPAFALFIGIGAAYVLQNASTFFNPYTTYVSTILIFIFAFFFSYYKVKDFYVYPQDLMPIAKVVSSVTNKNDKIVTDRLGDTTLLYLMDRKGSPAIYKSLEEFKKDDYKYLVTANEDLIGELKEKGYLILIETNRFAVIKL